MSDNKSNRGPADAKRINVNEEYEVQYWTAELEVTEDKLRDTVKKVGVGVVVPVCQPANARKQLRD